MRTFGGSAGFTFSFCHGCSGLYFALSARRHDSGTVKDPSALVVIGRRIESLQHLLNLLLTSAESGKFRRAQFECRKIFHPPFPSGIETCSRSIFTARLTSRFGIDDRHAANRVTSRKSTAFAN